MNITLLKTVLPLFSLFLLALACGGDRPAVKDRDHPFDDIDLYVKRFEDPERVTWQKPDAVVAMMKIANGDTIADIGAGTGYFTRRFAKAAAPKGVAMGYDIQPGMVVYMKKDAAKLKLANYRAELIDAQKPRLPGNYFSVIFICNTYHHISDRVPYITLLKKALKKNGRFVIVDYQKHSKHGPPAKIKLARQEVIDEFVKGGYRLLREEDFLPEQYYLEFGIR